MGILRAVRDEARPAQRPQDHRCELDGVFRIACTGAQWHDLPVLIRRIGDVPPNFKELMG